MNPQTGIRHHDAHQKNATYLSPTDIFGPGAAESSFKAYAAVNRAICRKRAGLPLEETQATLQNKLKRTKTFNLFIQVDNILDKSTGGVKRLSIYRCTVDEEGNLTPANPFDWEHLHMVTDMDASNVCFSNAGNYLFSLKITVDYDPSHSGVCIGKGAMKDCGLWKHLVIVTSAQNCVHGSTLSPPRLQQIRECVQDHMRHSTPNTDEYFLQLLPDMIDQLELPIDCASEGAAEDLRRMTSRVGGLCARTMGAM